MASPEVIYLENDPKRTRVVTGHCKVCARMHPTLPLSPARLVSPNGLSHHGSEWGTTSCGQDASGPEWWWGD